MSENISPKAARRAKEAAEKQAQDKKYRLAVTIICCVIVVLVLFVALFSSNLFYNGTTAVNVNGFDFTVADFNYNYFSVYNDYYNQVYSAYGQYAAYFMPSTSSSFRDQVYSESDGNKVTWADYFEAAALQRMERVAMLCTEAEKAGYTLSDEDKAAVEETVTGLKTQSTAYGYPDFQAYLTQFYGKGMTEKVFRENLLRDSLASGYSQSINDSFTYTPEQLAQHYAENADDYDYFLFRSYFFSGAAVSDDADTEEDETLSAEDAMKKAEEDAKAFAAAVSSEQDYLDYAASLHEDDEDYDADESTKATARGSSLGTAVKDWLTSADRKPGDVETLKTPEDSSTQGWYVVYFLGRDDNQYQGVSGYYAFFADSTELKEDDYETEEEYKAALKEDAEGRASAAFLSFLNSSQKDYDTFVSTMDESAANITERNGFENAGIYDLMEELSDWFHDEARVENDTTVLYVEDYGAFILFYAGEDGVYADLVAENAMRSDDYASWEEERLPSFTADKEWEMLLSKKIAGLGG